MLLGYFGFLDLGFGQAVAQRIAARHASDPDDVGSTFWTALLINASMGCIGGIVVVPIGLHLAAAKVSVSLDLRQELISAIPWLALAIPISTVSGVLGGALQGRGRFFEINVIGVTNSALIQAVPLVVAVTFGPSLELVLPSVLLSRLLMLVASFIACRRFVLPRPEIRVTMKHAQALFGYGRWVALSSCLIPLIGTMDRFVIGALLGARSIAHYAVPYQLAERMAAFPSALTSALFPRFSEAGEGGAFGLAIRALHALTLVTTPIAVLGIFFVRPFLSLWITPDFAAQSGVVSEILIIGFWANTFARVPFGQLQAIGRPGLVARCHIFEILPYMLVLYGSVTFFGLIGAAVAFVIRAVIDAALLFYLARTLRHAIGLLWIPSVLIFLAFVSTLKFPFMSDAWLGAAATLFIASIGASWKLFLDAGFTCRQFKKAPQAL